MSKNLVLVAAVLALPAVIAGGLVFYRSWMTPDRTAQKQRAKAVEEFRAEQVARAAARAR